MMSRFFITLIGTARHAAVYCLLIILTGEISEPAPSILGDWTIEEPPSTRAPFFLSFRETPRGDTLVMTDSVKLHGGGAMRNQLRLPIRTIRDTREQLEMVVWIHRSSSLSIDLFLKSSKPEYDALTLLFECTGNRLKFTKMRRQYGNDDVQTFFYRKVISKRAPQ